MKKAIFIALMAITAGNILCSDTFHMPHGARKDFEQASDKKITDVAKALKCLELTFKALKTVPELQYPLTRGECIEITMECEKLNPKSELGKKIVSAIIDEFKKERERVAGHDFISRYVS